MSGSEAEIEAMQRQLENMAAREQVLIQALNEALENADRRLLEEVRHVTFEHEVRRTVILTELQELAGRLGAFPISPPPSQTIEYNLSAEEALAEVLADDAPNRPAEKGGDWRKAAENIGEELDCYINRAGALRNSMANGSAR